MADLVTFAVLLVTYCAKLVGNMIEQSSPSLFTFAMYEYM